MVQQRVKDLLFRLVGPMLWAWGGWVRLTWPLWSRGRRLRLHLGCGEVYLPSFINADINLLRKIDLWLDLRRPLPLPEGVIEGIYTLETLEHLYPDDLDRVLRECLRVLEPGGFIRIEVPNLRKAAEAYLAGRAQWFPDWPRAYRSPGGRLSNFLLCDGQHRNAFDFPMLEELLQKAGFTDARECRRGESQWLEPEVAARVESQEGRGDPEHRLYVEARKP